MPKIDDGGMLYPQDVSGSIFGGITRRDWLAGLAMQGVMANEHTKELSYKTGDVFKSIADHSYRMTDAMIKQSKRNQL